MDELQHPHDHFVRATFSRPEIARDFLENYLAPEIVAKLDFDSLEQRQESFVDADLRPHHTDLLYRVKLKNETRALIYILLEHKSAPDKWTVFQLLRYTLRIWEKERAENVEQLPPIIPLVLYHGRRRWKASLSFAALIADGDDADLARYLPNFEHHLCDLSRYDESELRGAVLLRFVLLALQQVFNPKVEDKLHDILQILSSAKGKSVVELFGLFLRYYSAATAKISKEKLGTAIKKAFPEKEGELMKTMASEWVKEGIQEGKADMILQQLNLKCGELSQSVIEKVKILPVKKLNKLGVALFDFNSPDDLTGWLLKNER